jgi:RNA polymerase primary sigma factor
VARYRIDKISELARQMQFTPHDNRLNQLNAAEELLHTIDDTKAYPLEFVVFRITGYHPRAINPELLAGMSLQHDLGLLIEQVSDTLDVHTSKSPEPVLSIDDVTERFNVTSKTIQRWRRRGLPARRFVFPDGKRRVGFLVGSVERFFSQHRDQVARGTNFSQVDDTERQDIIRRARRLVGECGCCQKEVIRRVARKLNRAELTIQHILRKYDETNPGQAIFTTPADPITELRRVKIARAYRRGMSLAVIARRVCRPRTLVYRAIIEERLERLGRRKIRFIDDPLFHQEDGREIIDQLLKAEELAAEISIEERRVPRDLPPYLQELYRTPLLTPGRERALFLKFNFHKFQFVIARRRLEPRAARMRDLDALETHLQSATAAKNSILRANLRLVVSIARKHLRPGLSLMELVSDGNITLMRAVDGFDVQRGNKLSTYATLALMKGFARSVPAMRSGQHASSLDDRMIEGLADRGGTRRDHFADRDHVRVLLSNLSDRERGLISARYGLGTDPSRTLDTAARDLGISRHRARQIEKLALAKLRRAVGQN